MRTVVNIIPSHDVVPHAGLLAGTVVGWDCPMDALACHMPMLTPCGMHALCGSPAPAPTSDASLHAPSPGKTVLSTAASLRCVVTSSQARAVQRAHEWFFGS